VPGKGGVDGDSGLRSFSGLSFGTTVATTVGLGGRMVTAKGGAAALGAAGAGALGGANGELVGGGEQGVSAKRSLKRERLSSSVMGDFTGASSATLH